MRTILAIAIGGALGALARYGVGALVAEKAGVTFPWGTFVINITGAFVLGLLFALFAGRTSLPQWAISGMTIGFLGAYTTFSTFMLESLVLSEDGRIWAAVGNVAGSVLAGLVAVTLGVLVGRAI
jgi:CrcB protein